MSLPLAKGSMSDRYTKNKPTNLGIVCPNLTAEQNIFASFVCLQVLFLCRSLVFREQSFSASSWPQMALKALLGELGLSFTTITVIRHSRLKAFLRYSRTLLKSYLDVYKWLTCSVTSVTLPTSLSLT